MDSFIVQCMVEGGGKLILEEETTGEGVGVCRTSVTSFFLGCFLHDFATVFEKVTELS